jgi:signal transduction histidine kinase
MMRLLKSLWPNGIGGQIALIVLGTLFVSQLLTVGLVFVTDTQRTRDFDFRSQTRSLTPVVRMLAATTDPAQRQIILDAANRANPDLAMRFVAPIAAPPRTGMSELGFMERDLGPGFSVIGPDRPPNVPRPEPGSRELTPVTIVMPGNKAIEARVSFGKPPPPPLAPVTNIAIFAAIGLIGLLIWATRVLSRQLRNFANAAAEFIPDGDHAPIPETGPTELRTVAIALNRMRERIATLVTNRTLMLTAVGHDLRTPVTRLRLRAEFIADPETKAATLRDLDHMTAMIDAVLTLLRDPRALPPVERVDLTSLLRTITDDFVDLGKSVSFDAEDTCLINARGDDLIRAFSNVIENATHYGTQVAVSLIADTRTVTILIDDNGPGIPAAERQTMLQPFMRGDTARSHDRDSEGFGLGLAIAAAIIASHDGVLTLEDSPTGGLRIHIDLPRT